MKDIRKNTCCIFILLAWLILFFHDIIPHHHVELGKNAILPNSSKSESKSHDGDEGGIIDDLAFYLQHQDHFPNNDLFISLLFQGACGFLDEDVPFQFAMLTNKKIPLLEHLFEHNRPPPSSC